MSTGTRVTPADADAVLETIWNEVDCVCDNLFLAGSARRGEATSGDVDLVVVPRLSRGGLLTILANRERLWRVENKQLSVKTKQVKLRMLDPVCCDVDLFITRPENAGWALCLRTGPEEFTKELVTIAQEWGFKFQKGGLYRVSRGVPDEFPLTVRSEPDLFETLGLAYIPPSGRTRGALKQAAARRRSMR